MRFKRKIFKTVDEALCYFINEKDANRSRYTNNDWWWASDLGRCIRRHYWRRQGAGGKDTKEMRIKFLAQDGNAAHDWRQAALRDLGILIESEGSFIDEKLKIKGRWDAIVDLNGNLDVIDIKTQRPEAFFKRKKLPMKDRVKEFQKVQLACYYIYAKKKYPELKRGRLYIIDRGGGLRDEYTFNFSDDFLKRVMNEIKTLNKFWKAGKLPPAEGKEKKELGLCTWCDYKQKCREYEKLKVEPKAIKKP